MGFETSLWAQVAESAWANKDSINSFPSRAVESCLFCRITLWKKLESFEDRESEAILFVDYWRGWGAVETKR